MSELLYLLVHIANYQICGVRFWLRVSSACCVGDGSGCGIWRRLVVYPSGLVAQISTVDAVGAANTFLAVFAIGAILASYTFSAALAVFTFPAIATVLAVYTFGAGIAVRTVHVVMLGMYPIHFRHDMGCTP